jgi:hypothetical protein
VQLNWRIHALYRWAILDLRAFWSAVLAPLVALAFLFLNPAGGDLRVRAAGYALTILGVLLVAKGVFDTQSLFSRPKYRRRIGQWLKRATIPLKRRDAVVLAGGAQFGITVNGTLTFQSKPKQRTVSERLRLLEEGLSDLKQQVTSESAKLAAQIETMKTELKEERAKRRSEVGEVRRLIDTYSAGNLDFELVGLAWLVVGQAFAYFPGEIATLVVRAAAKV